MKPSDTPEAPPAREAGRSFDDPSRALGDDILARAGRTTAPTKENLHDRAMQAAQQAAVDRLGVGECAKVIGVLRKAEEFMSTSNPSADTDAGVRRALELACGRLGLTFLEYRALADSAPELLELERQVIADARRRSGTASVPLIVEVEGAAPEAPEETAGPRIFDRLFVPIDYTLECRRALDVALELRRTHGSALCLFHAAESTGSDEWLAGIGSPSVGGDWVSEAKSRLRRFMANVAPDAGADFEVRSRVGSPVSTLAEEARSWGATLVVACASLHAAFLRSPAEKLLRELRLPVLIIPIEARR